ncbi:hypothetical protein LWI29_030089 [Acer saccharum]|uniref:Uncharacterized protein n=1 Tax=Acer saccharum TaxID=4024 RepID=A0AA39W6U2_ACESA|nr:hypothetical protein LWI29_030089 [Acer saccharum]KAK1586782.1 hypothetical protein Q3G72_006074 [Acer saccharum]
MEKKKKDHKIACSTNQQTLTNDLFIKSNEEQNTSNLALDAKNAKTDRFSHGNETLVNQQYPPVLQWPHLPQNVEQSSLLSSGPCVSTGNQVQQGMPFWLPPRPGYQSTAVNVPANFQTFTPLGTINANWQQSPAVIGGVTSSSNQPQVSNLCYPVGYPHPGFPGPWDSSSWYAQSQQLQPSSMYTLPGGNGYFSPVPPTLPGCSASVGQSCQRGIIRPMVKLSQKHQQLWEAQSAENVQLWTVIGQLQTELAEYKSRQMKLEAELLSLKPAEEEPIAQVIETTLSGKASKRRRPRKSAASVDVLFTPDESNTRARGRKPAATLCKVQPSQARTLIFEKVVLNKVEKKEKARHSPATTQQENDEKIPNIITDSNSNMEVSGSNLMMPGFDNQVHRENTRIPVSGIELNTSLKAKSTDDDKIDSKVAISNLSQYSKGKNSKRSSVTRTGTSVNGNFGWSSNDIPGNGGRNFLNMSYQDFYDNGSVISQGGGKHIPGWSFVKEDSALEPLNDAVVASAKDDDEREMGDEASSGGEEIAGTNDEVAYTWMVR